jgi:hypothetical protein
MNPLTKYISRHQLWNPGPAAVRLYDAASGFSRKVTLPRHAWDGEGKRLDGKKVLVAMFRASVSSNFLDLYLYRDLKDRGADVKVVLCDGDAFPCDNIARISNVFNYRCLQCKAVQERFKEHIPAEDLLYVRPVAAAAGELALNAVASAKRFDMQEDYDAQLAARYQGTYASVLQLLKSQGEFDLVIMSHGLYATWGAFRDYCKDKGIDYITWGRTYFNKTLAVVKNSAFNEGPGTYDPGVVASVLHEAEYATLVESMEARVTSGPAKSDTVNYYAYLEGSDAGDAKAALLQEAGLRPIVAVYLSIPWDGTVYGANGEFESQRDLINSIVALARQLPGICFVFRAHPRESEMPEKAVTHINEALAGDQLPNLKIIEPQARLTSYDLAQVASLNILYSGTLAIEFAFAGYPLVVCGKNLVFGIDSVTVISTGSELAAIVGSGAYAQYRPGKQQVLEGLRKISTVLYDDDLTESDNYEVRGFKPGSRLINRIVQELVE